MRLFPSRRPAAVAAAVAFLHPASSPRDTTIIAGILHRRVIRDGEAQWVPEFEVRSLGLGRRDRPVAEMAVSAGRGA